MFRGTFHYPYKELVLAHQNNGHPLFKNPPKPKLYISGQKQLHKIQAIWMELFLLQIQLNSNTTIIMTSLLF
jgi:hypothetical protein